MRFAVFTPMRFAVFTLVGVISSSARSHRQHESNIACVGFSCSAYVQASLDRHIEAIAHVDNHIHDRAWEACNRSLVEREMRGAGDDALARASAFLRGCSSTRAWS